LMLDAVIFPGLLAWVMCVPESDDGNGEERKRRTPETLDRWWCVMEDAPQVAVHIREP
jgi:hypothetical protein